MTSDNTARDSDPVATWESLFRAQVGVMRALTSEFPTENLSLNEYDVVFNLASQPHCTVRIRDLDQLTLLTQPSISRLVDRLVARGYVTKQADPHDGRGTIVSLTEQGREMYRTVARAHARSISQQMTAALDDHELEQLRLLCDKLRTGLPDTRRTS